MNSPPVLQIFYFEEENFFTDEDGQVIENIFEFITPNDLYLFRGDPGNCIFPRRDISGELCEIVTLDEEEWLTDHLCPWWYAPTEPHYKGVMMFGG